MIVRRGVWLGVTFVFCVGTAVALESDKQCQSTKNKEAGKHAYCLQKAVAKYVKTDDLDAYNTARSRCDTKFLAKWARCEEKAGVGVCPDKIADPNMLVDFTRTYSEAVAVALGGGKT
jgi:hypothetical protein